jgi:hypothetical protein
MRAHALAGLVVVAFFANSATAQPGSMTGRVRGPGGVPFRGAQVLIDDTVRAVSDDSGKFVAASISKGAHRMMVRYVGFGPIQHSFRLDAGERIEREFTLHVNADTLAAVTIVGAKGERIPMRLQGYEDRKLWGSGRYIDRAQFEKHPSELMNTALRRMPGMLVKRGVGSMVYAVNTRAGNCPVNLYLDGMPIHDPLRFDLNTLPPATIAGVEYYASGATIPAQYHKMGYEKCGVMLIWTK